MFVVEADWQKALGKIRAVLYVHISEGVWAFLLMNQRMRGGTETHEAGAYRKGFVN